MMAYSIILASLPPLIVIIFAPHDRVIAAGVILSLSSGITSYLFMKSWHNAIDKKAEEREEITGKESATLLHPLQETNQYGIEMIPILIQNLQSITTQTEKAALEIGDAFRKIIEKAREGSEEANTVVNYFIATKNMDFDESYVYIQ